LTTLPSAQAVGALAKSVEKYGGDPWFRMAVLSSDDGSSIDLLKILLRQNSFFAKPDSWKLAFLEDFSYVNGSRNQKEQVNSLLDILTQSPIAMEEKWQVAGAKGMMTGLKKSATSSPGLKEALTRIEADTTRNIKETIKDVRKYYSGSAQP